MAVDFCCTTTPCACTEGGSCARDAVLHQHLGEVQVGADVERDDQAVGAVGRAGRLHVDHVLDAVHLRLDRQRHRVHHGFRAGAGVAGGDGDRRRHDVGVLRDRQIEQRDQPEQHDDDGEHVRQHRPLDEKLGDHCASP
jgi:hypothetical protein